MATVKEIVEECRRKDKEYFELGEVCGVFYIKDIEEIFQAHEKEIADKDQELADKQETIDILHDEMYKELLIKNLSERNKILETAIAEKDKEIAELNEWSDSLFRRNKILKQQILYKQDFEYECTECKAELSSEEINDVCYSCSAETTSYYIRFKNNSKYDKLSTKEDN